MDNEGYICFIGSGDLSVTVSAVDVANNDCYIKYKNVENEIGTNVPGSTDFQTIRIDPGEYCYEKQSDGRYKIDLALKNVIISQIRMLDTCPTCDFPPMRKPQLSRVIDFSEKAPDGMFYYDINGTKTYGVGQQIIYGQNINTATISKQAIRWNKENGNWEYYGNVGWCILLWMDYPGDMFWTVDHQGNSTAQADFALWRRVGNRYQYLNHGFNRIFSTVTECRDYTDNDISPSKHEHTWDLHNCGNPGIFPIMGGLTLPVNAVLWAGASGDSMHAYQWQSDAGGDLTTWSATQAAARVTTDACAKLKNDWGEDLRIYVVKYRKQTQYRHKATDIAMDFSYSYIDDCATENNSTYVKDVSDEAGLNTALQAIADNIKGWAGRTEAKNVE
jgi:hypothetical protein